MTDVVVVGAGVVGLTTALCLQQRGARVRILARDLPPATTSAVAAAIWLPYLAKPRDDVLRWSATTFRALERQAEEPQAGVAMQRLFERGDEHEGEPFWAKATNGVTREGAGFAATVPVCDTRRYLPWLLQRFRQGGGVLEQRAITRLDEAFALAPRVVNCSGLGARELCADDQLEAVRGQIVITDGLRLDRAYVDDRGAAPVYVVPRGEQVVLGGTAQERDEERDPRTTDTDRILADCAAALPELAGAHVAEVRVGLRPVRAGGVLLQRERRLDRRVLVHNYGHGGSGFTLAWGTAAEAAALALQER